MRTTTVAFCIVVLTGCISNGGLWPPVSAAQSDAPSAEAINRYLYGILLQREGRHNEAVQELERVVKLHPDSPDLALRLIHTYLGLEQYEEARDAVENMSAKFPGDPRFWILQGRIYEELDQWDKSVEAFRKAVELSPNDVLLRGALVEAETRTNDLVGAIDTYERLIELVPKSEMLRLQLAVTLMRIGDNEGAQAQLEKALELNPDLARARYLLGVCALELGANELAEKTLAALLRDNPDFPQAREHYAGALARLDRLDEAVEQMKRLIQHGTGGPSHRISLMYLLIRSGKSGQAAEYAPPNDAPIFATMMRALAKAEAEEPYLPVIESLDDAPGDIDEECNTYLSELLYLFGEERTSEDLLDRLRAVESEDAPSKRLGIIQARVHMITGNYPAAEDILARVAKRFGPDENLHYYQAVVYEEQDKVERAEKHLKALLELNPTDHEIMNFLGYMYAEQGIKLDEAKELLDKALELDEGNPFYLDSLGWVYYKKGNADKAVELIRRAILDMEGDDAVLRDHLGDAYALRGDHDKAVSQWRRAHRLDPDLEGVKQKIERIKGKNASNQSSFPNNSAAGAN